MLYSNITNACERRHIQGGPEDLSIFRNSSKMRCKMASKSLCAFVLAGLMALLFIGCRTKSEPVQPKVIVSPFAKGSEVLLQGNDSFGIRLLQQAHSESPGKNIVVAPLSLTMLLGAIQTNLARQDSRKEFDKVFGWGEYPDLRAPARMMLAAMAEPRMEPESFESMRLRWRMTHKSLDDMPLDKPRMVESESLWMSNCLLYRSLKIGPALLETRFMESASADFGLKLVNTGDRNPSESDLRTCRGEIGRMPPVSKSDQVWFSSGFHLRQSWEDLFHGKQPEPGQFRLESGQTREVLNITSAPDELPHLKTDEFEVVALPCGRVWMIFAVPASGMKVKDLEQWLVTHPGALNSMSTPQIGSVTFPQFAIKSTLSLEKSLKAMRITDIFLRLDGIMPQPSFVTDIKQNIDFGADKHGINADAETMIGATYVGWAPDATFQMSIDRPFVFMVRDAKTNALVLVGSLMDPADAAQ
jgi:serine protease inhibitor